MITIIVGITSKRKGFLSNLQHYKFVLFFVLFLSSFTKFNAHNFMYSRVVVNRLSTAWPGRPIGCFLPAGVSCCACNEVTLFVYGQPANLQMIFFFNFIL